jgi:hypothetical protein
MIRPKLIWGKNKKDKIGYFLKRLYDDFPNHFIPDTFFSPEELKYIESLGLIEKIPKAMVAVGNKIIGKIDTYRLTLEGINALSGITSRKINSSVKWLTISLVLIGLT